jgi:hypothetical protein
MGYITQVAAEDQYIGWVFSAWQFIVDGTNGIVMRQWVKFGVGSPFVYNEAAVTVASYRTLTSQPAWTPGALSSIGIGGDIQAGDANVFSMSHMKVFSRSTKPTEAEINAIALQTSVDTSAWGDYLMEWVSGAADISDRSGNGRNLSVGLGAVSSGLDNTNLVPAGYAVRQSPIKVSYGGTSDGTLAASFEVLPVSGNLIVVEGGSSTDNGSIIISDNKGNNFTVIVSNPAGGAHPFIAYLVVPATYTGTYTIAATGLGVSAGMRIFEWQGNAAAPLDWASTPRDLKTSLTIPAPNADTYAGTLIISSMETPGGFGDQPIYPAGWYCDGNDNGGNGTAARKITYSVATESIPWALQASSPTFAGAMVGFRPYVANPPPLITLQPQSQVVKIGGTATFNVIDTYATSYQWQLFSGTWGDISGATSASYTTGALTLGDDGSQRRCVTTNAYGTATSQQAGLNIHAAYSPWRRIQASGKITSSNLIKLKEAGASQTIAARFFEAVATGTQYNKATAGTLSFSSGIVSRATSKFITGGLSFIGVSLKLTRRSVAGGLSFLGSLAASRLFVSAVGGTLSMAGSISKTTSKLAFGSLSFTGGLIKRAAKSIAGSLSFTGSVIKTTKKTITGALSMSGVLGAIKQVGGILYTQAVGGVLGFSGAITKAVSRGVSGSVSFSGLIAKRYIKSMQGGLSFTGILSNIKARFVSVGGTLVFSGGIGKKIAKNSVGLLSSIGIITKKSSRNIIGSIVLSGFIASAKVRIMSIGGSLAFSGVIGKEAFKSLGGTLALAGSIIKNTSKSISASIAFVGLINTAYSGISFVATLFTKFFVQRQNRVLPSRIQERTFYIQAQDRIKK